MSREHVFMFILNRSDL